MINNHLNIAVIEPSDIVYEGFYSLLLKNSDFSRLHRMKDLSELQLFINKLGISVVILNPVIIQNRLDDFLKLKLQFPKITWIGLLYSFFANDLLEAFDWSFGITESVKTISNKLSNLTGKRPKETKTSIQLTERETEVLIKLTKGLSNKEIAESLNITTHTVISHRKNIVEKTGIKSLPGLTIFAISKKIISL